MDKNLEIAVIIPCFNEEAAISNVVNEFAQILPQAEVYVFDNASTDNTSVVAEKAGRKSTSSQ